MTRIRFPATRLALSAATMATIGTPSDNVRSLSRSTTMVTRSSSVPGPPGTGTFCR